MRAAEAVASESSNPNRLAQVNSLLKFRGLRRVKEKSWPAPVQRED